MNKAYDCYRLLSARRRSWYRFDIDLCSVNRWSEHIFQNKTTKSFVWKNYWFSVDWKVKSNTYQTPLSVFGAQYINNFILAKIEKAKKLYSHQKVWHYWISRRCCLNVIVFLSINFFFFLTLQPKKASMCFGASFEAWVV